MFSLEKSVPLPEPKLSVEKYIPIPEAANDGRKEPRPYSTPGCRGSRSKYPFHEMSPGDSFFVPAGEVKRADHARRKTAQRWGLNLVKAKEGDGLRIWRVE